MMWSSQASAGRVATGPSFRTKPSTSKALPAQFHVLKSFHFQDKTLLPCTGLVAQFYLLRFRNLLPYGGKRIVIGQHWLLSYATTILSVCHCGHCTTYITTKNTVCHIFTTWTICIVYNMYLLLVLQSTLPPPSRQGATAKTTKLPMHHRSLAPHHYVSPSPSPIHNYLESTLPTNKCYQY